MTATAKKWLEDNGWINDGESELVKKQQHKNAFLNIFQKSQNL